MADGLRAIISSIPVWWWDIVLLSFHQRAGVLSETEWPMSIPSASNRFRFSNSASRGLWVGLGLGEVSGVGITSHPVSTERPLFPGSCSDDTIVFVLSSSLATVFVRRGAENPRARDPPTTRLKHTKARDLPALLITTLIFVCDDRALKARLFQ